MQSTTWPWVLVVVVVTLGYVSTSRSSEPTQSKPKNWQSLPLVKDGKIHESWNQIGLGGFRVEKGTLRTDCTGEGWGLLVYKERPFGNCQLKVVYRCAHPKANSGIFLRMARGILDRGQQRPVRRNKKNELLPGELDKMKAMASKGEGAWYATVHGFEVQIQDQGPDAWHRTGAIYSLSRATAVPKKDKNQWRTMIITLKGKDILVDVNDPTRGGFVRLTKFRSGGKDTRKDRQWYEPTWGPRPIRGYIGLQNHDPGDVVYFREVSVRALPRKR